MFGAVSMVFSLRLRPADRLTVIVLVRFGRSPGNVDGLTACLVGRDGANGMSTAGLSCGSGRRYGASTAASIQLQN